MNKPKTKKGKTFIELVQETRRTWNMNPVTRIAPNKKNYNRKRDKKEMENI